MSVAMAILTFAQTAPEAAPRTFAPRYTLNAKGDIAFVSNANMTCNATGACATAQQLAYSTGGSTNNNYTMQYVDIDGDPTTTNSSSATLSMPAGASVAFAGLYWAGQTTTTTTFNARNTVKLKVPGSSVYQIVTATQIDDVGSAPQTSYQGFRDVTAIISAAGAGVYSVADIASNTGGNQYAGWTLVVVYTSATIAATRNLTVYDGYQRVASNTPPINIALSGFLTPPFGPVNTKLGVVGYDGDRGSGEGSAGLLFGPNASSLSPVSNGVNPQTDVFNSTISTLGVLNAGLTPSYQNTLGYDADIFAPNTPLPNGANSAAIRVQSSGETIDVGVITLATDIFVPNIKDTLVKSVAKVAGSSGTPIIPGDTLEYTLFFYNAGQDGALNVVLTDNLPANVTYVANSIVVTNTPVTGAPVVSNSTSGATDATGDDLAEYLSATRRIVVRGGTGASATQGGTLIPATPPATTPSVQVKFRVTVDANTVGGTVIDNFGSVSSRQQTLGGTVTDTSDSDSSQAGDQPARVVVASPDLVVTKTPNGSFVQGQTGSYTITVSNSGPAAQAPTFGTVAMTETPPSGLTLVALSGTGWSCTLATATCTRGDALAVAASYPPITATFSVAGDAPSSVTNRAAVTCACESASAQTNNSVNTPTSIVAAPVLASSKVANGAFVRGSTASYTLTLSTTNAGSGTNGTTVTVTDNLPGGLTLSAAPSGSGWSCTGAAGDTSFSCTTNATIAANASFPAITVPVRVGLAAPSEVVNTFSASGGGAITPTSATAITPVAASTDRSVSKSVRNVTNPANSASPNVGDTVEFTLTASNGGPSIATNVVVNDLLNSGFTFVSATPSQGTYANATGVWTVGTLQPNSSATLRIRATVATAGTLSNTATIVGDEPDPVATNNTASVTLQGQSADLSLTKAVDNATPNVGSNVVFTLTLSNAGPSTATNVEITDLLPASLSFVSATPSGLYDQSTGKWTVSSIGSGASTQLQITAKPITNGAITNKVEITKSDQFDPDSTPANGIAGEDDMAQVTLVAQQADLSIAKSVDNPAPLIGETLVYTVTVTNAGPSTATGVVVSENIPAGLTLLSSSPSQGSFTAPTWSIGSIAAGARAVLTISARYDGPGRVTNTASITASDQPDPTPNTPVSVTVPSQTADLSLQKTVSNAAPNVGSNVTFTLTLSNAGPDGATGVIVSDLLPPGLAVVSTSPSQGSYDAVSGDWTVGSVANGGNATLQIVARVTGLAPITNLAEVKVSRQFDPDSTPNNRVAAEDDQASASLVPQAADLRLAKGVSPSNPTTTNPNVVYTIRVTNNGPSTATNVLIAETLPTGVALVVGSANVTLGSFNAANGEWSIPSLANATTATLTFTATVSSFGVPLTNSARIVSTDQPDPTPESAATATVLGQQANLSLAKTANTSTPTVGGNVSFTLTLTNAGPNAATGVKVRDLLPTGLSFVSASTASGAYDSATGMWDVGTVSYSGSPASVTLTLVARVSQTTSAAIENRAEVAASDQFDPNSTPNNLPSSEDDEASFTITPIPQADLSIAKSGPAALNPGASASYDIIVTNLGPSSASSVTVSDPTPPGLTLVGVSGAGCSSLPCNFVTLGVGESRTITVNYSVNFPASDVSIANTASVSSATADPSPSNNSNTLPVPVVRDADLRVVKTGSSSVIPGEFADYQIVVTNNGPATAASVQVTDPTPPGFSFIGASAPCTAGFPCNLGNLTSGQSVTISVRYRVGSGVVPGVASNTASASSTGANASPDPNTANNSSTVQTTIEAPRADVGLTKVGPTSVLKGQSITYTLTASNAGPSDAVNVAITDPTPTGLTLVSVTGDCASLASGGCVFATLPVGVTRTVQVTFSVPLNYGGATNPAQIENRAQISADSADPNGGNNTGIATSNAITPPPILSVTKTSSPTFTRGSTGTYTIVVNVSASGGPTTGAAVTVADTLPNGVTLNGLASGSGWTCTASGASAISCSSSAVVSAGTAFPAITVPVIVGLNADAAVTNAATAQGGGAITAATGSVDTPVTASADLALSKGVDRNAPTSANPNVVFTLTAENFGPSIASNVAVQDLLPAGMTFISATPSLGSYNAGTGAWNLGNIPPGTRATLTIRAQVTNFTSTLVNVATISAATADPNSNNNQGEATIRGQVAELSLTKTVANASPNVQSEFDFVLTVSNAGPNAATGVSVSDPLANGLVFESATPANYDPATGVWNVGTLAANASSTLTLRVKATSPTVVVNRAQIASSDQFDPNSTPGNNVAGENDDASATVFPQQADVRLAKSVNNPNPQRDETVVYVVELSNLGPSRATNILVNESLPVGVDITSIVPSSGVFDAATGNWGVASVDANARATLTISGVFRGPGAQTNTASVLSIDQFDPTPNAPVSVTIPSQIADLSLTKSVSNSSPTQGTNVTFTIGVANAGPNRATGVQVTDLLPSGLGFVSPTASAGSYDATSGVWNLGAVDVGATPSLQIVARVDSFTQILNTASVSASAQYDPDSIPNNDDVSEDDQASVTITPQSADLRLSKRVNVANPNSANPNVVFTIELFNAGPSTANAVTIADAVPAGVIFTGSSASVGSFAANVWSVPSIAANTRATLTINATVSDFTRPIINTAQIVGSSLPDPTPNEQASATVQGQAADLSLTKTASVSTPRVGEEVIYTVRVANAGPDTATNVSVLDRLAPGLLLTNVAAAPGSYDPGTGVWSIGSVAAGSSATLTLTARVSQTTAAPIGNRAEVRTSDQFDPNSTPNNNVAGENDQAEATITPVTVADLTVAKLPPARLNPGTNAAYTIVVKNLGPSTAQAVQLADPGPAGLAFVSATGCASFPCSLGNLLAGEERTITATYAVPFPYTSADPQVNTATVSSSTFDPNLSNNTDAVGAGVDARADLQIEKSGTTTATAGTNATFTLTVTNAGPSSAGDVTIDDPIQPGIVRIVSVSGAGCSALPCSIGTLAVNASATVTVIAQIDPAARLGSTVRNTAIVSSTTPDPAIANNSGSADVLIGGGSADLRINKTGPARALPGQSVSFAISVNNAGPSDAQNVTISDPAPANFTITAVSGVCTTLPCQIATLAANTNATITVTGTVNALVTSGASVTNVATVSSATPDPVTVNNSSTATVAIDPVPDLVLRIDASATVTAGVPGRVIVTASNQGGAATSGLHRIVIDIPQGATALPVRNTGGYTCTVVGSQLVCETSNALAVGGSATIEIDFTFSSGAVTLNGQVSGGGEVVTSNNSASATIQIAPSVVPTVGWLWLVGLVILLVHAARRGRRALN